MPRIEGRHDPRSGHRGRQWEILVRGLDDVALERLRFAEGIVAVESRTPSLEEIFVAYMTVPTSHELAPSATTDLVKKTP